MYARARASHCHSRSLRPFSVSQVHEGGDDDPKAMEALAIKMTKEERYAAKVRAQESAVPVLIEISKHNAKVCASVCQCVPVCVCVCVCV